MARCRTAIGIHGASALLVTLFLSIGSAADWPQWRGPNRDAVWREEGLLDRFANESLKIKWRTPIGAGYSGPTVADGRVFVSDRVVEPHQAERVHCFDAATGKPLWTFPYECQYSGVGYTAGPRASVTVEDGRAYALGTMGHFHCLDAAKGDVLWKKDLAHEYNIRMPIWGIAAAPLVCKGLVIVQIGGEPGACLVAFDKTTGKEIWRALDDDASYSSPIVIRQAGRDVMVCWTGDSVAGLNPESGGTLWLHPFQPKKMVINIATPVVDNDRIFLTSFYDGSFMLKLDRDKTAISELWQRAGRDEQHTDGLHSIMSTPYFAGDYLYGVDSYGELRCLDAKTGDRVWENLDATPKNRWSTIHMVRNGDRIWMFNERGELIIARLSPKGFEEISRAKLLEPTEVQLSRRGSGVCWSHPAYAYRHVFARNDQELVCADLTAGAN